MKPTALHSLLMALALLACAPAAPEAASQPAEAPAVQALEPLQVLTAGGPVNLRVAVADDDAKRARGLMYRTVLAPDEGMLFDFHAPRPVAFWMKNTLIPLDMIFIAADGRIVNIAANTTPHSLEQVPSQGPVRAVLEIAGGRSAELGIAPGDRVVHRIFPGE